MHAVLSDGFAHDLRLTRLHGDDGAATREGVEHRIDAADVVEQENVRVVFFWRTFSNLSRIAEKSWRIALGDPVEPELKITSPGWPRSTSFRVSGFETTRSYVARVAPSASSNSTLRRTSAISRNFSRCARIKGVSGTTIAPSFTSAMSAAQALGENEPSRATTWPWITR